MILVIGYGNTLRSDDGLGPFVAAAVRKKRWANVRAVAVAQLTPELAEPLATALAAVFIDARLNPGASVVEVGPIRPAVVPLPTHVADPRCLLALAESLFGQAPPAWFVSVAGADFGLGETLSTEGRRHAQEALEHVERLFRRLDGSDASA